MIDHCNLLPTAVRRHRLIRGRLRRWGTALGVALVALTALAGWHLRSHGHAHARLNRARTDTETLRASVAETATHRTRLVEVRGQLAARERIVPTEDTLHVLDLIGRGHRRTSGRLAVGKLKIVRQRVETPSKQPGGPSTTRETTRVEVTGVALDDGAISQFVATLRSESPAGRIELQSGAKVEVEGREARRYVVVGAFE